MQQRLIEKLEMKFWDELKDLHCYGRPETPRFEIVQPNDEDKIDSADQSQYRFGVGMLLYHIKNSRPDLANIICYLSKYIGLCHIPVGCIEGLTLSLSMWQCWQRLRKFVSFVIS
jgi:hypothetical protein